MDYLSPLLVTGFPRYGIVDEGFHHEQSVNSSLPKNKKGLVFSVISPSVGISVALEMFSLFLCLGCLMSVCQLYASFLGGAIYKKSERLNAVRVKYGCMNSGDLCF